MLMSPRRHSTAADLLRLAAAWLAVLVLVQSLAAALAIGQSAWHRHRAMASDASTVHHHDGVELHQHDMLDSSVLSANLGDIDSADLVLAAALAMAAATAHFTLRDRRRHVWRPNAAWTAQHFVPEGLLRPPRRA